MALIELRNLDKRFGTTHVVKSLNLDIADREFLVLLGPSGCGKTTTMRMIAGLEEPSGGDILFDGVRVNDVPTQMRDVAMVFQNYGLYPHMNVFDNIAYPLKLQKLPLSERQVLVDRAAARVGLQPFLARMPRELSGGQRQRVALARAIVRNPQVFLMDEPLSNLDAKLRVDLRRDIRSLQQELGITTLYVTHDQEEALSISDLICVMHDGVVQQVDTAWAVYNHPANRFVATFVGSNNFAPLQLDASGQARLWGQPVDLPPGVRAAAQDGTVASARPEVVHINPQWTQPGIRMAATVRQCSFTGRELQVTVEVEGHGMVDALAPPTQAMADLHPGTVVQVGVRTADLLFFAPGETGKRLQ